MLQRFLLLSFFIYFQISSLKSQTVTATPSSGCVPLSVSFTVVGGSNYSWDFGNGASAGNVSNPTTVYNTPGTFTVTFTSNGSSQTLQINVFPKPTAGFEATTATTGCIPLPVSFKDTSVGGGGTSIVAWEWAFGDGGGNTSSGTPTHSFSLTGSFNVSLIITDANGCKNTVTTNNYISTSAKPNIVINPDDTSACFAPLMVPFSAAASTPGSGATSLVSYVWSFGNGDSSSAVSQNVTYDSAGVYSVIIIVTDNNNCSKTDSVKVIINNPVASFSVANDTVCKTVTLTNLSSSGAYKWNFGDGISTPFGSGSANINGVSNTTGIYNIPTHTYANPLPYNPYDVTLNVTNTSNGLTCTDDTTITIYVDGVHANFTSTPDYSCGVPFTIQFTDNSTNAAQWDWSFGNDSTDTVENPINIIMPIDTNPYTVHWMELFDDYLLVTSPHGCTDDTTFVSNDTLYKPTALFMPDTVSGCFPLTVTFYDSSISKETIVNWKWDFGDGTIISGGDTIDTIPHVFNAPGEYEVYLIITNALGCIDTSYTIIIEVGKPPSPNFSASPLQVCPGDSVQFTDLTPLSDSVDTWHYVTDGILMWACKQDPNPGWAYSSDVGFMDVTLTAGYNGCFADTTITNMVEVLGPIGRFRYEADCDSSFVYSFFSESKGTDLIDWYFGDGTNMLQTTNTNPVHTYSSTGDYSVILIAYNNTSGCPPSSDTIIVRVRNIKAVIGPDSLFCSGVPAGLDASNSIDVYNFCHRGFRWDFGDNTPPVGTDNPIIDHSFDTQGFVDVRLVVRDTNGCTDTAFKSVLIHFIDAGFVMDTSVGYFGIADTLLACVPSTIVFTDTTVADTGLFSWVWNTWSWNLALNIPAGGYFNSSTAEKPTFSYTSPVLGLYKVSMTVTDSLGCADSTSKFIRISFPDSTFGSTDDRTICVGDSVEFNAVNSNPGTSYSWNFGEGGTDTIKTPTHVFDSAGNFNVTLTVTDSVGCKGTKTLNNTNDYVQVQGYPIAGFFVTAVDETGDTVVVDSTTILCYPQQPVFHDTSHYTNTNINQYIWDLGTGSAVLNDSMVTRNCNTPDVYPISLIVMTSFGCSDTVTGSISLVGPIADFTVTDNLICRDDSITFILKDTTDVFIWHWDFGDGFADSSVTDSVTHVYDYHPPNGQTIATLVYWGAGKTCKKSALKDIFIYQVIADFDIIDNDNDNNNGIDTSHCLGFSNTFLDSSSSLTDSWNWDFGDGITVTGSGNKSHTYTSADTFDVQLSISNVATGCVDTIIKKVIVYPLPEAMATGNDTCAGDSIRIFATGGLTYSWSPVIGLSNPNDSAPMAGPSQTTVYSVTVTDGKGCEKSDTAEVIIYQQPPQLNLDTTIVIGEEVPMNFDLGSNYTYNWTPTSNWLTCTTCPNPTAQPLENILYEVVVEDNIGCFSVISSYDIIVLPDTSIDVPDAFTPEAAVNNIVYVKGWGIKTLLEFKIYNRWGQMVYENPMDIKQGWDGTYLGKLQNMDTYVYYVKAETYLSPEPISKSGHLLLIR